MKTITVAVVLVSLVSATSAFADSKLLMSCTNVSENLNFGLYETANGAMTGNLEVDGRSIPMVCDEAIDNQPSGSTAPRSIGTCHNVISDIDPMMAAHHTVVLRGSGCFSPPMATYTSTPGFCGVPTTQAKTMVCQYVFDAGSASTTTPAHMEFVRDLRPVDGNLTQITLTKTSDGKYDATRREAFFDRINGQSVDNTTDVDSGMQCKTTRDGAKQISKVDCLVDNRPVDGALTELVMVREGDTFKASLRTAFFDRRHGKDIDVTSDIATGLKLAK